MAGQPGFFDLDERYRALSAAGDALERLSRAVDFELFRPELDSALDRSDRSRGGRPPYDAVLMFKVLVLQTLYTLSDDQTEYQLRDRLSFMRFVGLALHDPVPDAKTIGLFREQLTRAGAVERLFRRFDTVLKNKGLLAMGGWCQHRQWGVGRYRLPPGRQSGRPRQTGAGPHLQRPKPRGKSMPAHVRRGNATRGKVRAAVEHVFACQKQRLHLVVRTVGIARAKIKLGLANLACNLLRFIWLEGRAAPA
jgi:hypothetical protein